MKLIGKCREDFKEYLYSTWSFNLDIMENYDCPMTNALIVEFFDAQKIFINIKSKFGNRKQRERFSYNCIYYNSGYRYDSRQEALNEAILTANKIYNER